MGKAPRCDLPGIANDSGLHSLRYGLPKRQRRDTAKKIFVIARCSSGVGVVVT